MDKVNVLVVSRTDLYAGYLEEIAAVDPRISIKDGVKSFVTELRSKGVKGANVDRLEQQAKLMKGAEEDLDSLLAEAEVILGGTMFPDNLLTRAPRLKWVHITSVGVDRHLSRDFFKGDIMVTNSRGCTAIPIAEHVLTLMLMLAKNAPCLLENKRNRRWERFIAMELRDRVVGLIGLGAIGSEVARLTKGMGMKVIATRKSATRRESGLSGVDSVYPLRELPELLHESDFVVIAAPLTEGTRRMIGEAQLRAMKSTSFLINVARGPIVDEPVLIRALKEGWIAGAGLDVFETEPLPPDNELWQMPNVILTPHMAGSSNRRAQRLVSLFCENLARYVAGQPLQNVIDKEKAY